MIVKCACRRPDCKVRAYLEMWEMEGIVLHIIGDPKERMIVLDLEGIRNLIGDLRDAEMTLMLEEQTRRQE